LVSTKIHTLPVFHFVFETSQQQKTKKYKYYVYHGTDIINLKSILLLHRDSTLRRHHAPPPRLHLTIYRHPYDGTNIWNDKQRALHHVAKKKHTITTSLSSSSSSTTSRTVAIYLLVPSPAAMNSVSIHDFFLAAKMLLPLTAFNSRYDQRGSFIPTFERWNQA
jgi:hypothetical protein